MVEWCKNDLWMLNIWIELIKLVLQIIIFFWRVLPFLKTCLSCSGLLRIDKKNVRQPETFLFLPGQKSIMVATFPTTCSGVLWDGMFHGFNQFGFLFLWFTYCCILKTWVIFCCSFFFFPAILFTGWTNTYTTYSTNITLLMYLHLSIYTCTSHNT